MQETQHFQRIEGQRVARGGVAQQAHSMPAPRLLACHVPHVAEKAADRRPEALQDAITRHHATLCQGRPLEETLIDEERVARADDVVVRDVKLLDQAAYTARDLNFALIGSL